MSADRSSSSDERFVAMLAQARQGQLDVMGHLLEPHREGLMNLAQRIIPQTVRGQMGADDAALVTLLSAYEHFDQFRGKSVVELSNWLWSILVNTIRQFVRTEERHRGSDARPTISLDDVPDETEASLCRSFSPCDALLDQERTAIFQRCFDLLPERYQQVLRLHFDENLGFAEIGSTLGMSAEAARKKGERAMLVLGDLLRENGMSGEGS